MGSGQSVLDAEASKPADASDVATYEDARNELMRVRALLRSHADVQQSEEAPLDDNNENVDSATAATAPPPLQDDAPDKAYNQNVVSVFRSHVLQRIGPDGRNDDDDDGGGGGGGGFDDDGAAAGGADDDDDHDYHYYSYSYV